MRRPSRLRAVVALTRITLLGDSALAMSGAAIGAACAPMADSTCDCPPGTAYMIDPGGDHEAAARRAPSFDKFWRDLESLS